MTGDEALPDESSTRTHPIPDRAERRRLLILYGRKAVLEALQDSALHCRTLHVATSNRRGGILAEIEAAAERRQIPRREHSREALARISRNGRQDQGIALDVLCPAMRDLEDFLAKPLPPTCHCIALDGVTNPQNMGMAIRSATAAGIDGVLYADRGNPALGPLVIKASAGTVFRAPLLRCATLAEGLTRLIEHGSSLYRLDARGERSLYDLTPAPHSVFVLGGETDGISREVQQLTGQDVHIPMANGVESLNVAVSAALVSYALHRS